jgi:modulator of FtsH protease HflK
MAWNEPNGDDKNNDPWRDKRRGGGKEPTPPDLDEALRQLQRKFKRFFNSGGGGVGGSEPPVGAQGFGIGLSLLLAVIVVLWALSGIFIVSPAEQSVVLRFGKYVRTEGPGPHWIPRFIDSQDKVNVQRVSNFTYTALMLNKDENIVSVQIAVQYRIANPHDYLFNVVNPLESLQQATASALRQVVGHTTLDDILTVGREKVRQQVSAQLKQILERYKTGLIVTDVAMQPAKAPEEVKSAFDDAIKAQEDQQRFENQAKAYAARVVPIAEGDAKRIFQEAKAYHDQVILQAKGAASRFESMLTQYKKAPKVTRERLYLDMMESVLTHTSKILVDVKGSNNLLYLPVDKIMSQIVKTPLNGKANGANQSGAATATAKPPLQTSILRGRMSRSDYQGRGIQ